MKYVQYVLIALAVLLILAVGVFAPVQGMLAFLLMTLLGNVVNGIWHFIQMFRQNGRKVS